MIMINADSGLYRHRYAVPAGRSDRCSQDHPEPIPFVRQRRSPTFAGDFGDWATKIQVDMINAVFVAQDLGRLRHDRWVDAVELNGPYALPRVELKHLQRLAIPLYKAPRSDHLADVQSSTLLTAQLPKRRVRDTSHRSQHHRRINLNRPHLQRRLVRIQRRYSPAGF